MNVTTHHNDNARTGANLNETILTVTNVHQRLGRLFERKVNGATYAQPLYVSGVRLPTIGVRNVLYVATMRNMVYAFDADNPAATSPLWGPVHLGPPIHLPDDQVGGPNYRDIEWEVGIVGTPVIDPGRNALYVVAAMKKGNIYEHQLNKLDLGSGALTQSQPIAAGVQFGAPIAPGGGPPIPQSISFRSDKQNQRPGLALANGRVYVGFAGYFDLQPYQGWIIAFDADTLTQQEVFCTSAGIWMAGEAPALDAAGNLYFTTGNGSFNPDDVGTKMTLLGDCFVKLTPHLQVASWFSPFNNADLANGDFDLGSAGVLLVPNSSRLVGGGKEGKFYLLERSALGGFNPNNDNQIPQSFYVTVPGAHTLGECHHIHGCPTVWTGPMGTFVYIWPEWEVLKAFQFSNDYFVEDGAHEVQPAKRGTTGATPGMPGGFLSVSANGVAAGSGIVWANHPWYADANQSVVEGVLRAYDASNLQEIWNSRTNRVRDDFGNFAKFCPPTVCDGKVYVPTMGGLHRKVIIWDDYARGGVALANVGDSLLVLAWTGVDSPGHLNVRWSTDGMNWTAKTTDWNETSWQAPALATGLDRGRLFLAWTGTDGRLNVHTSFDRVHWLNKITLSETSDFAPALLWGNGRLFLAWTGTDGRLNVISSTDGISWGNKVTLGETSPTGPALAFVNGMLFLLWCGTDSRQSLNLIRSANGLQWTDKVTFGETSDSAPALAVDDNMPFLCWRGRGNQHLNQMTPRDGDPRHFEDKRTFPDTTPASPSLAKFQDRIYVGWTGTDGHLNVAVLSLGGVSAYSLLPIRKPNWLSQLRNRIPFLNRKTAR